MVLGIFVFQGIGKKWLAMAPATKRDNGMRNGIKSKILLFVALVMGAAVAQAGFVDASIMIDRAANNKTLTVKYDGARASTVELRINGQSIASKKVSDQFNTGETTFDIDVAALESGNNKVEIRLYDAGGKLLGTENSEIKIDRSREGPVYFTSPKPNSTAQGTIDIQVGFKSQLKNIYVSFFVNDEFKILKNYAPYTYHWDTMTVPNGWHEVQAWVVDDANATFKTEKLRIFVDNPGGRTKRQDPPATPDKPVKPADATAPVTAPIKADITKPAVSGNGMAGTGQATGAQAAEPHKGQAVTISNDPARPGDLVVENNKPTQPADPVKPAEAKPIAIVPGVRLPDTDRFDIYLGGEKINFDVAPRVTDGIPLSPFRHLIESYGGEVKWTHATKEVDGDADGQTIWFKIGDPNAKVNGQTVQLERAPFIENGRSIVPLSFMTAALHLDISYDPATGHVLIQTASKK